MNRLNRIAAILIKLQSQRVVRAQDIADTFSISLRTVYRDIRTLEAAGIPIVSEAGVGYSIMKGYFLPPVMFSHDEAVALMTAQKFVEKMADRSVNAAYGAAMTKIKAILEMTEKDSLQNLDPRIEVRSRRSASGMEVGLEATYQSVLSAIAANKVLNITYQRPAKEQPTVRDIEAIGVFFSDDSWYCIAWCRLRNDYRSFRLDRIQKITITDERLSANHPTLKEYLQKGPDHKDLQKIVVEFDNSVLHHIGRQKYYLGFVEAQEGDDKTELTFLTNQLDAMSHWLLMFIDQVRVVSPPELREKIQGLVRGLSNYYL